MEAALNEFESIVERAGNFEKNFRKCSEANRTKGYLKGRIAGLEELWKDRGVKNQRKPESCFEDTTCYGLLEEKYYQLKGEIQDQLDALKPQGERRESSNGRNNQQNQQKNYQPQVKLHCKHFPDRTIRGYHSKIDLHEFNSQQQKSQQR